ncbi:MAG: alpha-amylase family glycosyl hydrolase [Thiolinea sp.]
MYKPELQSLLQHLLAQQDDAWISAEVAHAFHTRLAANFFLITHLFRQLYGTHPAFAAQQERLILCPSITARSQALRHLDQQREADPDWFLSQHWTGMAMYGDRFAGNLTGIRQRLDYLQELGVNMIHIMPMMRCPAGANDGGYAISDFRAVDSRFGSLEDVGALSQALREQDMLLTLDIVINHTSDEHEWAQRAQAGEATYCDYCTCIRIAACRISMT